MANANEELLREVRAWAKKMGCPHTVPDDLIDASNAFIWRQVVDRCHPKHEIEQIRRNLLLQQQNGNLSGSSTSKEYNVWNRKESLQKKVELKKRELQEATNKCEAVLQQCKLLSVQVQTTAANINEAQQKTYLYGEKQQLQKEQICMLKKKQNQLNEMLTWCRTKKDSVVTDKVDKIDEGRKFKDNRQLCDEINKQKKDLHIEIEQINQDNCLKRKDIKKKLVKELAQCLSKLHVVHIEKCLEVKKLQKMLCQSREDVERCKFEQVERLAQVNGLQDRSEVQLYIDQAMDVIEEQTRGLVIDRTIAELACKTPRASVALPTDALKKKVTSVWMKLKTYKQLTELTEQRVQESGDLLSSLCERAVFWGLMSTYLAESNGFLTTELKTFQQFNLQYNRRAVDCNNRSTYASAAPWCAVDCETLRHVQDTLVPPAVHTERILRYYADKMAQREKLEAYLRKSEFSWSTDRGQCKNYILEELQECEAWIQPAIDMHRSTRRIFNLAAHYKRLDLREDCFFSHYVCGSLLHNGKKFAFYEDQFMEYFRQIC